MIDANARNIVTCVLRALADRGQAATAEAAGLSDTRLSRWKDANCEGGKLDLEQTAAVLAALHLRVIPADGDGVVTIPGETWAALHVLLRDYADRIIRRCVS